MRESIDINCDVGERPDALRDGSEELLIRELSSANIACGAHAGDEDTMRSTLRLCSRYGVSAGAHPGYPDREDFGRRQLKMTSGEIEACVFEQVQRLAGLAASQGLTLTHVKAHGALYNCAARDQDIAAAIGKAVSRFDSRLTLFGLAGSGMLDTWRRQGLRVAAEAFADRRYEDDGSLRPRGHADALITSSTEAAQQALRIVRERAVVSVSGRPVVVIADTICVHSDTPGALDHLLAIRAALHGNGISVHRA